MERIIREAERFLDLMVEKADSLHDAYFMSLTPRNGAIPGMLIDIVSE